VPDDTRVFLYNGPIHDRTCETSPQAPVTPANGLLLIKTAFLAGRKQISEHFKRRARERDFDTMDVHNVIKTGKLRGRPDFCPEFGPFGNWKYRIVAELEDMKLEIKQLEIVVALDPAEDYEKSPVIILVTGYWR
jgi:hypothetical protein